MSDDRRTGRTLTFRVAALLVLVAVAGTVTAATVLQEDPDPIVAVEGQLTGANDLTVDGQQLEYDGVNVTAVNVTVNNTAGSDRQGTIHAALKDGNGTTLASATTDATFGGGGTTAVVVSYADSYSVENVARVEVTVERTG